MIKKILVASALVIAGAGFAPVATAAESTYPLERAPNRQSDMIALQNGARLFVNHCLNCHSANVMRYNKLADLGLTDEQIKNNLLFTSDKVGDMMNVAMRPKDARAWFGTAVPDLSVMARQSPSMPDRRVRTTSTRICAPSIATPANLRAGTTWCSPVWPCRTSCGPTKGRAN